MSASVAAQPQALPLAKEPPTHEIGEVCVNGHFRFATKPDYSEKPAPCTECGSTKFYDAPKHLLLAEVAKRDKLC